MADRPARSGHEAPRTGAGGTSTADASGPEALGQHVFVANVGGAGMSAVAVLLAERGHRVTGHDPAPTTPYLEALRRLGVEVHTGPEHPELPTDVDSVVVSTATPADAPEVVAAGERGIPVLHRRAALAELCAARATVAVAGTHGKSTTAAMLATILAGAGLDPGWVVGAPVPGLGRNAAWGGDGPLVVEADESDSTFLALPTTVALVTNVEPDHIEHYGDFTSLVDAFEQFLGQATGACLVGADDDLARDLGRAVGAVTVGCAPEADVRLVDLHPEGTGTRFSLVRGDPPADSSKQAQSSGSAVQQRRRHRKAADRGSAAPADVQVPMPGRHNARNAAMALAAAEALGVPFEAGAKALAGFQGVGRRFEPRGSAWGATLIDDYAHLPSEVAAAISAARDLVAQAGRGRVVCVFQPHRFSRTATLWRDFADAFVDADILGLTDIYAAGEEPRPGVTGKLVLDAVLDAHPWRHVAYLPRLDDVVTWLRATLRSGDVCLTLGAGDLTTVPTRLVELSEASEGQR